jgi:hypothetical protein
MSRVQFLGLLHAVEYLAAHIHEAPVWIVPCLEAARRPAPPGRPSILRFKTNCWRARALGLGATLTTLYLQFGKEVGGRSRAAARRSLVCAAADWISDRSVRACPPVALADVVYGDWWGQSLSSISAAGIRSPAEVSVRLPPLNAIKAFEAAARPGSFTRAAEELNVTHGTVSRQIRLLEDWLGTRLFARTSRNAVPTRAGTDLSAEAGPALDRLAAICLRLPNRAAHPRGASCIGAADFRDALAHSAAAQRVFPLRDRKLGNIRLTYQHTGPRYERHCERDN